MKKRRTLIVSLLLVAAMVMGIGYAALTSTLTINGTASLNNSLGGEGGTTTDPKQMQVYFTKAEVSASDHNITKVVNGLVVEETDATQLGYVVLGSGAVGTDTTVSGTSISAGFKAVGLKQQGDYVTFNFTVSNASTDVDAYLQKIAVNTTAKLYQVEDGSRSEMSANFGDYFETAFKVDGTAVQAATDFGDSYNIAKATATTTDTLIVSVTIKLKKTLGSSDVPTAIDMDSLVITLTFDDNDA